MFRCYRRRKKLKYLVALVSVIALVYIIYQVKSVPELTREIEIIRKPVRGVHYTLISHYNGAMRSEFVCLFDRETIDSSKINDDYCDCEDGTDEPGTNACTNGKFYCESDIYKRHGLCTDFSMLKCQNFGKLIMYSFRPYSCITTIIQSKWRYLWLLWRIRWMEEGTPAVRVFR